MHMVRIYHHKLYVLFAHELTKIKPVVTGWLYSYQCFFKFTFLYQFHNRIVKAVESLHRV